MLISFLVFARRKKGDRKCKLIRNFGWNTFHIIHWLYFACGVTIEEL